MSTELTENPNHPPSIQIVIPDGWSQVGEWSTDPNGKATVQITDGEKVGPISVGPFAYPPERPRRSEPGDPYPTTAE